MWPERDTDHTYNLVPMLRLSTSYTSLPLSTSMTSSRTALLHFYYLQIMVLTILAACFDVLLPFQFVPLSPRHIMSI